MNIRFDPRTPNTTFMNGKNRPFINPIKPFKEFFTQPLSRESAIFSQESWKRTLLLFLTKGYQHGQKNTARTSPVES